jgi:hypothetical protein
VAAPAAVFKMKMKNEKIHGNESNDGTITD